MVVRLDAWRHYEPLYQHVSMHKIATERCKVPFFCTAEKNPSKSNSYPKHVYFFRSIQMTNFAALRAGHLSLKEYSWFVSSLLRVTAPDSTTGNSRNSGEIPQVQGVFLEVWFSWGQATKYKGSQKVFLKCESDIFSNLKCILTRSVGVFTRGRSAFLEAQQVFLEDKHATQ